MAFLSAELREWLDRFSRLRISRDARELQTKSSEL